MNQKELKRLSAQELKREIVRQNAAWNKLVKFKVAETGVDKLPSGKNDKYWNFTEDFVGFALNYREKNPILSFIADYALEDQEVTERAKKQYANNLIEDYLEGLKNQKLREEFNTLRFNTDISTVFETTKLAEDLTEILSHDRLLSEYDDVKGKVCSQ